MVKYSLCPQTCSFPDILDFFLSCTHTHTHIINIFPLDWIFPSAVLRELQNTPGFCPHRRLIPHSSLSSLLNWVGSMTHSSDVYIYCQQCLYAAVYLCIYTCLYVNSCIFFFMRTCTLHAHSFTVQNFNYSLCRPARPASGMKCQPVWQEQVDIMLVEQMWQPRPAGGKGAEREAEKY